MSKNEVNGVLPPCPKPQRHVHEVLGSVEIAVVKIYRPDDKKDSHYEEDRKDHYKDEYKDSDYEYEKSRKDPCYDYEKPKKDPCYDYEKPKKDPCYDYDKPKKDPCYDYDKPKKDPCYDYHEDKKDFWYDDEDKKDPHKHCPKKEAHNHRFAKVTGEAIPYGCKDHYHEVKFRTDFYEGHYHSFSGKTGGAIRVGDRHVHFLESQTTLNADHSHDFRLATLIEDPIGD